MLEIFHKIMPTSTPFLSLFSVSVSIVHGIMPCCKIENQEGKKRTTSSRPTQAKAWSGIFLTSLKLSDKKKLLFFARWIDSQVMLRRRDEEGFKVQVRSGYPALSAYGKDPGFSRSSRD